MINSRQLGSGFAFGDSLDCNSYYYPINHNIRWEMGWGNDMLSPQLIKSIINLGFTTIKIPVTWDEHIDYNEETGELTIHELFLSRVKTVVSLVIKNGCRCIINTQHDSNWLIDNNYTHVYRQKKFYKLWKFIANEFKDFNKDYLIYEDFNEIGYQVYDPNDKNILNKDEVSITMNHFNNLTKDFIKAIREVDGDNERTLIVDTIFADVSTTNFWLKYNTDFLNYINEDGNCILAYHFYYPNSYTIVNADESAIIGTGTMESFKESILKVLKQMEDTKVQNGLDYCITEFGCNRQNKDEKYIYEWYKTIYDFCKEHKVGLVMWNDGKESKEVINRVEAKENIPGLIDIIHDYNLSV